MRRAMEQRKQAAKRYRRRVEVRYGPAKPECVGYSGNISGSGIMIRTTRVFAPGTLLNLELKLPDKTIKLCGRVTWAREGGVQFLPTGKVGMGVRFVDPPPAELTAILT
jgi:uncharacterized protein (TIGR02266 family)